MKFLKKIVLIVLFTLTGSICADTQQMVIKSGFGAGFFADLRTVMRHILCTLYNDTAGKDAVVDWTQEFFPYKNGVHENGWDLFFEPLGYIENIRDIETHEVLHDQTCLNKWVYYSDFYNYRAGMHALIERYIKIRPAILAEVENYYSSYMKNFRCIGVHVRFSAAHASEKPGTIKLEDYFKEIDRLLKRSKRSYRIYLATDSNYVIQEFKKKYKHLLYTDTIRSNYMEEIHLIADKPEYWFTHPQDFHASKPGYKGGKDVLVDCLLLSKCRYLVHSTSNVSDFATFFNPELKSVFLPKNIRGKKMDCAACFPTIKWYA